MRININEKVPFENRHNGPNKNEVESMLSAMGLSSIDELIDEAIPDKIRLKKPMNLPQAFGEFAYLKSLRTKAQKNNLFKSFIGQGYYNTEVPTVIQRNILENPAWYTAYTPYQAEISQGRLEALINFQTVVIELTSMEIANASLLDEATAAAEAATMLFQVRSKSKKQANTFFVDYRVFPQTLSVLKTRLEPSVITLEVGNVDEVDLTRDDLYGIYFQYPDDVGQVKDRSGLVESALEQEVKVAVGADLLSLCILTPPGEWGVDVVVGTSQRFGVPFGYGGPHAAFFATKEEYKRHIPGRIIGASKDVDGNNGFRMALQTREQHIKRERATSNICTAQVLLAVMSSMYAVYHGPKGLEQIAIRVHGLASAAAAAFAKLGIGVSSTNFFDTLHLEVDLGFQNRVKEIAKREGLNFRYFREGSIGLSFDETHRSWDIQNIIDVFAEAFEKEKVEIEEEVEINVPIPRESKFLDYPVFKDNQSEHELLRYMKRLENKDLSLVHSMISLGSCTMKLNATTEMIPVSWPEFSDIHPFSPQDQVEGYHEMIEELGKWLKEITGFAGISFQPNSGAQGEYAGLMAIRSYHKSNGDSNRNIALIPSSAHGTNPASAVMAGMKVVIVKCDEEGNIDVDDLLSKADQHKESLSALMITYPSTHGVYEERIMEICDIVHANGGQVYMDGANMNAQVGLTSPAMIGADVCHLNLHKTFCIPHGGGGPGMGPIGVAEHLVAHLPGGAKTDTHVSAAEYGSASILLISHAYIAMMGEKGLTSATKIAILNANYIGRRLTNHYPILYTNEKGRNAHELIIDCRAFKKFGIEVEDIAKRMMDYGYHAPTVSFPVAGTMMIEPTESETKAELDKFCDVMISIRREISEVMDGLVDRLNNVLKNAPHTQALFISENWKFPYTREKAAFPLENIKQNKFWPSVRRIDSAYGDRNLMCTCIPIDAYEEPETAGEVS